MNCEVIELEISGDKVDPASITSVKIRPIADYGEVFFELHKTYFTDLKEVSSKSNQTIAEYVTDLVRADYTKRQNLRVQHEVESANHG